MKIVPVVLKAVLRNIDESYEDMLYWLSKSPKERIKAVAQLRANSLQPGQRLDESAVVQRKLHP